MTDETTHLRALLADATARAERAEADYRRVLSERAEANQLAGRCAQQRDQALAACAEMRAALLDWHGPPNPEHSVEHCPTCALLARPDLGRGMVVEREVLERSGGRIKAALDDIYETWVNADEGGARTCDEATVGALKAVLADLDALLKKGGV